MDEVDGNSRDTSTEGSSGSVSHIQPELYSSHSVPLPRHQSSSQLPGEITYSPQLRRQNSSWNAGTDVDRTDFNYGPKVASSARNQFGYGLATRRSEISLPTSPNHDNEIALSTFPAGGGGGGDNTKLPEMTLPSCQQSRSESQSEFLFREDEGLLLSSSLHSGVCYPPQPDSRSGHTFELRSDLNPQYVKDLEQNSFMPKLERELSLLSLRQAMQPHEQLDLREHLPKPDPTARKEINTDWNARMREEAACQISMTGSVVQQCSDVNYESYVAFDRECYEGLGNSLPREMRDGYIGAGHLEHIVQNQDALLRSRDEELLQLKEANHKQSLFIEKVLTEKRLLETAVVEQARLLMSNGAQRPNAGPGQQPVVGRGGTLDSQLYEAQLATYREDFENERKEKLLIKGSADSIREQLMTALNELRLIRDKLQKTEAELERYKNPYRAAYQPYLQNSSSHSNSTASSSWSSQSAAAGAQNKTPLYRKLDQLEPDRANQTVLATSTKMDHLSQMATGHETKVSQSDLTRPDQPCWTEERNVTKPSQLCQSNRSGTAKKLHVVEYQVNRSEMKKSGQVNQIAEMSLTRQGQYDWMNNQIVAY